MLLRIPEVLTTEQVIDCRLALEQAEWEDGRVTAGHQSVRAKRNLQVPQSHPVARRLGDMIVEALERNSLFISGALPRRIFPPLFNRYDGGQTFGPHVDNAIRQVPNTPFRIRTDLSATLFLTAPDEYHGGDLVIEDTYGLRSVKLPAGDMIVYPAGSLHEVREVTRGTRLAAFFWIQSMVRDDGERTLLFDLDSAVQKVNREMPESAVAVELVGVYHNLLRRWASV